MILCSVPPNHCWRTSVCIIGGGPAAFAAAFYLEKKGRESIVLPGGGWEEDSAHRDLHRGGMVRPDSHEPLEDSRYRAIGGAAQVWGGKCIPLNPIDFEARPWLGLPAWPISFDEYSRCLEEASTFLHVGAAGYSDYRLPSKNFAGLELPATDEYIERFSLPTNPAIHYRKALALSQKITLLTGYSAVFLRHANGVVQSVEAKSLQEGTCSISADEFLLAAGAQESTRLLLHTAQDPAQALGNRSGRLGKGYASHIMFRHGLLRLNSPAIAREYSLKIGSGKIHNRRRLYIHESVQRREGLLNGSFIPLRPDAFDPDHGSGLLSLYALAKGGTSRWKKHLSNVFSTGFGDGISYANHLARRLLATRKPHHWLPTSHWKTLLIDIVFEHIPVPSSSLSLSGEKDALGLFRLVADLKMGTEERRLVPQSYRLLDLSLKQAGIGRLEFDPEEVDRLMENYQTVFHSSAHQYSTMKMAAHEQEGVVNSDGLVFGTSNLHAATSATFPTPGHANPTLSIVAFALRTAKRISAKLESLPLHIRS